MMEAIVLAGGLGTRLSSVLPELPKPMAPINGQPFLKYILDYLLRNGISKIILAVGYKADIIKSYFGDNYLGINLIYSLEDVPLGTGGAIKKALSYCNEEDVFIINGDTYFNVDLKRMKDFHYNNSSYLTIAVKLMNNFERYGAVIIDKNIIKKFKEKEPTLQGKINGGIYLIKCNIMDSISEESFSFEKTILESGILEIFAFESDGYFIDIGVPEDYYKAQNDFKNIL